MSEFIFTAQTAEEALEKAMKKYQLPARAIEIIKIDDHDDQVLEGAEPLPIRVKAIIKKEFLADRARQQLQKMLSLMGIAASITSKITPTLIKLDITATESSLIIGRKGATLQALEHIVNRMVNRGDKDLPLIILDVKDYKAGKIRRLERLASKTANEVRRSNKEVRLRPMASDDRKIIHNFIKGFKGVYSYSQGKEGERQVIIAPEKKANDTSADLTI